MQTGYQDLDALIGEFSPGDLVILGGRSGTGRSSFALDTALYTARHGEAVAIFSYETTRERVKLRLTSSLTSVPLSRMLTGDVSKQEWLKLIHSSDHPVWSRLAIVGSANLTVGQMGECVRRLSIERMRKGKSPVVLVVVDPLRLMGPALPMSEEQRRHDLGVKIVQLKQMARDLHVSVLLVGELNPGVNDDLSEPPALSDLEPPGVAESYADKILLLHRNMKDDGSGYEGAPEVVAKQRSGRTGKVRLA
jgi:replicative DNA helicase